MCCNLLAFFRSIYWENCLERGEHSERAINFRLKAIFKPDLEQKKATRKKCPKLFSPFVLKIAKPKSFWINYKPFQKRRKTISLFFWNSITRLQRVIRLMSSLPKAGTLWRGKCCWSLRAEKLLKGAWRLNNILWEITSFVLPPETCDTWTTKVYCCGVEKLNFFSTKFLFIKVMADELHVLFPFLHFIDFFLVLVASDVKRRAFQRFFSRFLSVLESFRISFSHSCGPN